MRQTGYAQRQGRVRGCGSDYRYKCKLGLPDVERDAGAGQPGAELPTPQVGREPAGARQQVDGFADGGLADRLEEFVPGRAAGQRGPAGDPCGPDAAGSGATGSGSSDGAGPR